MILSRSTNFFRHGFSDEIGVVVMEPKIKDFAELVLEHVLKDECNIGSRKFTP